MKFLITFLCSLMISSFLHAQDETELVKKVKAKLDKVNDYQADGKMKIDVPFINAPESDVVIYFKKPDKYKVKKSGGISILPKGGVTVNTNTLLMNDHYDVVPAKSTELSGIPVKVVKLLPTDENSDVVLTTLYIDDKNLVIRKASVNTKENGSYDIELSYGKFIDWGLPDKVIFSFNTKDYKLPKGITFDYEKGEQKKDETIKNKKGKVEITYSSYKINKGISDEEFKSEP